MPKNVQNLQHATTLDLLSRLGKFLPGKLERL